jgi:hypothetical protein
MTLKQAKPMLAAIFTIQGGRCKLFPNAAENY